MSTIYTYENPPLAYPTRPEGRWATEPVDTEGLVPEGFISDFVNSMRGVEAPAYFALWGGLFMLAAALRRFARIEWYPKYLYPNLYVFLVAPPGVCKKGAILNTCSDILQNVKHVWPEESAVRAESFVNIHEGKATPEGLHEMLSPVGVEGVEHTPQGRVRPYTVDRGSQISLVIGELSTFLGKQKYNVGLVQKLTDLFDGRDTGGDYTKGDKLQELSKINVNLFAGTTPADIKDALPQEAFGGGLMSRTILVWQEENEKIFAFPHAIEGTASLAELARRLAWIIEHARGTYRLSAEALDAHTRWYTQHKTNFAQFDQSRKLSTSRMDNLILRLALLIRASRYTQGTTIELSDYVLAQRIMAYTYGANELAVEDIGASQYQIKYLRVKRWLQKWGECDRKKLLRRFSAKGGRSQELVEVCTQLLEEEFIEITVNGKRMSDASTSVRETYKWIGPAVGEEDEADEPQDEEPGDVAS